MNRKLLANNVPNDRYKSVFQPIISQVMEWYRPGAIVLQCGADSLAGDKLGCFNLSMEGHSSCVEFVLKFGVPVLVLGGGGYTMRNVARAWAYETGLLVGQRVGPGTHPQTPPSFPPQILISCRPPVQRLLRLFLPHLYSDRPLQQHGKPQLTRIPP
jgi:acetoin utilization deacetylase AcuC-like enzyme